MFVLSKMLHSSVTNPLTFENQANILPIKEWFWRTKLFLLSIITKHFNLN